MGFRVQGAGFWWVDRSAAFYACPANGAALKLMVQAQSPASRASGIRARAFYLSSSSFRLNIRLDARSICSRDSSFSNSESLREESLVRIDLHPNEWWDQSDSKRARVWLILEILCCDPKGHRALLWVPSTEGRGVRLCWALSKPKEPKGRARPLPSSVWYRGYSKLRTHTALGPYRRSVPRSIGPS